MRKLYLIVDEWNNDKNFVGSELNLIKQYFNVTVICNGRKDNCFSEDNEDFNNITFVEYYRRIGPKVVFFIFKCFFDKKFYEELQWLQKDHPNLSKLLEIIRFYVNSELFYDFLKKRGFVENQLESVFYTYWFFWKCFALTKNKKKLNNSRIITRAHQYDLFSVSIKSGYQPFKHSMDESLDKIIFIAEHGRQFYINKYASEYLSFDEKSLSIMLKEKYLLYHLGTQNDKGLNPYKKNDFFHIVSCSRVIARKRIDIIIDALAVIDDISIKWTHFGDGDLFESIKKYASSTLGQKTNIEYDLRGYTHNESIKDYYFSNSIDVFITTSISEGNPISVIEAMSFGIPVITTNICNMPNLVKKNGIIISDNPSQFELANAIREFANSSDEIVMEMRKQSRNIWDKEYKASTNDLAFVKNVLLKI